MTDPTYFNRLSPAELERLAILSEELGEAQQAVGKILRHGYESCDPTKVNGFSNRISLIRELGDIECIVQMMCEAKDIPATAINYRAADKAEKIKHYLHHQEGSR